jgi:hypothetical protein
MPRFPFPATLRKPRLLALLAVSALAVRAAPIPAFPGAEGFGAYAAGGRGGDVYRVTTLSGEATAEGSLAYGLANAPEQGRTIVFAVSGYIPAPPKNLRITKPRITIAGQTAPGGGVGLRGGTLLISAPDVVIQHLRLRHGRDGRGGDCLNLDSNGDNVIVDHVSMQFSTDENMSSFKRPPENLTLQHSLNAWGLETHSCGGLWDQTHATAHHNLWAHNHTRNPKARPDGLLEWINNVTFDWDIGFIMGDSHTPMNWKANVIGNTFISPPGNLRKHALEKAWLDSANPRRPNFSLHLADNLIDNDGDGKLNGVDRGYEIVEGRPFDPAETVPAHADTPKIARYTRSAAPFPGSPVGVQTDSPRLAYKKIVSSSGALRLDARSPLPLRDEVDTILLEKLVSQTRFHVKNEKDTGASAEGFGILESSPAPLDTDRDGMPDTYETALGWAPDKQDHGVLLGASADKGIHPGTTFLPAGSPAGYTRLDEYLHFLASPHAIFSRRDAGNTPTVQIDLSRYTLGFNSLTPNFTVASRSGGTIAQSGPGGRLATFTPAPGHTGRARFEFTVSDSDGDTRTQSFLLLVPGVPAR